MGLRNSLYKAARIMGDINAVKKGRVGINKGGKATSCFKARF